MNVFMNGLMDEIMHPWIGGWMSGFLWMN